MFVAELNTSDGSLSTGQRLTGYASDDREANTLGFTAFNNVLYMTTFESGSDNPHLYSVNPLNGNLTVIGDISPDDYDLVQLALLGEYIYAHNSNSGQLVRAPAVQGNRWEVIFPFGTSGINELQQLTLRVGENGDDITLDRYTDITNAYAFVSDVIDALAHTISVGDSLEVSLHKPDGTQLYDGTIESFYRDVAIT